MLREELARLSISVVSSDSLAIASEWRKASNSKLIQIARSSGEAPLRTGFVAHFGIVG